MKLKNILIIIFIMCFNIVSSQTITQFSNLKNAIGPTATKPLAIVLPKITTLKMLSQIGFSETMDEDYKAKNFPEKFNWALDVFRMDSYKRMALDFNKKDRYGRYLPRDISQDLINQVYFKDNKLGY